MAVQIVCIIPARLGSSRLPHKPLQRLAGEPLVHHVARRALELEPVIRVVVAADDRRILDAVADLPVETALTSRGHRCGTERVAEVATHDRCSDYDAFLSIQSDEPFFPARAALGALERLQLGDAVGTAAAPLSAKDLTDPNRVKVVVDGTGHALRFARVTPASGAWGCDVRIMHHIGIYAFTRLVLKQWMRWRPSAEERTEGLEQLRALEHGVPIGVAMVGEAAPVAVDTAHDLQMAEAYVESLSERVGR